MNQKTVNASQSLIQIREQILQSFAAKRGALNKYDESTVSAVKVI